MRKLYPTLSVVASLASAAAGCGSTTPTTNKSRTTPATTPDAVATANLNGSYVRTVTKADMARTNSFRHEGTGQSSSPAGTYHLTFAGGTFRVSDPTGFAIAQTYAATNRGRLSVILYVNPNQASFCGPDIPQSAAYQWTLNHNTLALNAKVDGCADRDSILQGRWTRVGS